MTYPAHPTTLTQLGALMRDNAEALRSATQDYLYNHVVESRQIFAIRAAEAHVELAPAVAWVLEHAEADGALAQPVLRRLYELGRDHRRHGFPEQIYAVFADALCAGIKAAGCPEELQGSADRAVRAACAAMAEATHAADLAGAAPAHTATVVAVERPNRHTAVVRLEAGLPFDYHPGQHIPVTTPHLPGTWRYLTPASPADTAGQLTFHITDVGEASSMLAKARPGDLWTLGTPRGEFVNFPGFNLVFISYGAGWAAVRPYLLSLVEAARRAGTSAGFKATVYAVAPSPGEHYDTFFQANLMELAPWITIHHVVRREQDPWLLGAGERSADVSFIVSEEPIDAVVGREKVSVSNFVLVGPSDRVRVGRDRLIAAGVNPDYIEAHPWERGGQWARADQPPAQTKF